MVSDKNQIDVDKPKKTGRLLIRQLNRRINESANSVNIFSPKTEENKDNLDIGELIRWLISYQQYTTTVDKTKVELGYKFSRSAGWLYRTLPTYITGQNLFDTLVMNMVKDDAEQKPIWAWNVHDYINQIQDVPNNLAQLYTLQSRMICIIWQGNEAFIYTAALPMPNQDEAFIEPMSEWYQSQANGYIPARANNNIEWTPMVLRLNHVFQPHNKVLAQLPSYAEVLGDDYWMGIATTSYINDGKATSQAIIGGYNASASFYLRDFTNQERFNKLLEWSQKLEDASTAYYYLNLGIAKIRRQRHATELANRSKNNIQSSLEFDTGMWLDGWSIGEFNINQLNKMAEERCMSFCEEDIERRLGRQDFARTMVDLKPSNVFEALRIYKGTVHNLFKN